MRYDWKAIPELAWTGFSAALAGLVVAILVALDVDAAITGAVGVFIGATFRLIVAFLGASAGGTVTTGTIDEFKGG